MSNRKRGTQGTAPDLKGEPRGRVPGKKVAGKSEGVPYPTTSAVIKDCVTSGNDCRRSFTAEKSEKE